MLTANGDISNSILLGASGIITGLYGGILIGSNNVTGDSIMDSIIIGTDNNISISSSGVKYGSIICGQGNKVSGITYNKPKAVFGYYGTASDDDLLIVGSGTSSANANCFATGNDGTNDYIKIGDTKITETQLQQLLALLLQQ